MTVDDDPSPHPRRRGDGGLQPVLDAAARLGLVELVDTDELLVRVKAFAPGERFDAHWHTTFDEVFIGLAGQLTIWVGDAPERVVAPSDVLVCPRGVVHRLANTSAEPASILVVKAPNARADTHWAGDGRSATDEPDRVSATREDRRE